MGSQVAQIQSFDHGDIDPNSIIHPPSFSHDDIDPSSISAPPTPKEPWLVDKAKQKLKDYGNATVEILPALGAGLGGTLGAIGSLEALGVGAVPGAGIGGTIGTALKNTIRGYQNEGTDYLTRPPTAGNTLGQTLDLTKGAIDGVNQEGFGQVLGLAGKSFGGSGIQDVSKQGLTEAASRLGIKPTTGMLSKDYVTRGIENSLEKSPTVAGAVMRGKTVPVRNAVQQATSELLNDASQNTNYQTGLNATQGISAKLGEKYANAQMAYENFNQELPKMIPDDTSKWQLADQISGHGKGNLSLNVDMEGYANKVANKVMDSKSLGDLEGVRKQVGNSLSAAYRSGDHNAIEALSNIQDRLSDYRDNQFVTLAQQNYPGQAGSNIGHDMVSDYQNARSQYASIMNDLKEVGPVFGIKNKSPQGFIEALQNIPPEQMSKKLFTPNNIDKLNVVNQYFPEEFQQVKNMKLAEISKSSMNSEGSIDPNKFLKQVDKLQPEVQHVLFGDNVQTIKDIKKVAQSFPPEIGPSGTPKGVSFMNSFNPLSEVPQQLGSLGQLGLYGTRGSPMLNSFLNSRAVPAAAGIGAGAAGTYFGMPEDNSPLALPQTQPDANLILNTGFSPGTSNRSPNSGPSTTIKPSYKLKGK